MSNRVSPSPSMKGALGDGAAAAPAAAAAAPPPPAAPQPPPSAPPLAPPPGPGPLAPRGALQPLPPGAAPSTSKLGPLPSLRVPGGASPSPLPPLAPAAPPAAHAPAQPREPASIAAPPSPPSGPPPPPAAAAGPGGGPAQPPHAAHAPSQLPPLPGARAGTAQPAPRTSHNGLAPAAPPPQLPQPQPLLPPPPMQQQPQPQQPSALPGAVPGTPVSVAPGTPTTGPGGLGGVGGGGKTIGPPPPPPPKDAKAVEDYRPVEEYIPFGFAELRARLMNDHDDLFRDEATRKGFLELCKRISLRNALRLEIDYGDAHEKFVSLDPDKDTLAMVAEKGAAAAADAAAAAAAKQGSAHGGGASKGCCGSGGGAASVSGPGAKSGKFGQGAAPAAAAASDMSATAPPAPVSIAPAPVGNLKERVEAFRGEFDAILDKAEFKTLDAVDLEKAKNDKSLMGLNVVTAFEEYLDYRISYRGTRNKKIKFTRWGVFKREIEMKVYERLALEFRLKKPVRQDDVAEQGSGYGEEPSKAPPPWSLRMCCFWNFCACCTCCAPRKPPVAESLRDLRDEYLYMKLFKDVLQCDVDMLMPGSIVRFTWFDYVMIWAPILFGCACAVWKAVTGSIDFSNLVNAALSVVLIVMPLTWGVKAWLMVKDAQRRHEAHLNKVFILHNLNNNGGVISQLLEEAEEQEDNEAMLAYFFLWRGEAEPKPRLKAALDYEVECYLQRKLDEVHVQVRLDFEVTDAVLKLERMGLLSYVGEGKEKKLQVLPLDKALEAAHMKHFNEEREAHQIQPRSVEPVQRASTATMAWHEVEAVFEYTGQKFRYYWNAETGESQYWPPAEPYIPLSEGEAVDVDDAAGEAMRDKAKNASEFDKKVHTSA